ncbi:hypothetical protein DNTS_033915 [Danionella cerebrum]|uniref:Uncharacterized protein n=1 Tax=Danionella cerebrum TaxID=2873325 RepID=A0A553N0H9_9TELE|nr:hypothetical protein DNTS_033915 [Danionella translucida]
MSVNSTCIIPEGKSTGNCSSENTSPLGLAVGLPVFCVALLLLMGIAAVFWFKRRKVSGLQVSDKLKCQERSSIGHSKESPYSGYVGGPQPAPQSPIYENFQRGEANLDQFQRSSVQNPDTQRVHQVQLQCDPHEAIYCNDPALFHPDQAEVTEDVYIMPDA